ncbi:MAG TPA: response regulator [Flavobacterium sp.]|jgi:CheY-like chemotaxis protein
MNKKGPIIIIEDDEDDTFLLREIFKDLEVENEIICFTDGNDAYNYFLKSTEQPFMIMSDINMPVISGFELRDKIFNDERLRFKRVPYLFFTTSASQKSVVEAYDQSVQGFFVKPSTMEASRKSVAAIIEYWKLSMSPY